MEQRFSNAPLKIPKLACFSVFKTTQYPLLYRRDRSSLRGRRGEASVKLGLFYLIRFVQFSFILIQQGLLLIKKKILAPMRSNLHGNGDLVRLKERINLSRYPSPHSLPPPPRTKKKKKYLHQIGCKKKTDVGYQLKTYSTTPVDEKKNNAGSKLMYFPPIYLFVLG